MAELTKIEKLKIVLEWANNLTEISLDSLIEEYRLPKENKMVKIRKLINEIRNGTHKQFILDYESERVKCKCGHDTVFVSDGYVCGTITAYRCDYSKGIK